MIVGELVVWHVHPAPIARERSRVPTLGISRYCRAGGVRLLKVAKHLGGKRGQRLCDAAAKPILTLDDERRQLERSDETSARPRHPVRTEVPRNCGGSNRSRRYGWRCHLTSRGVAESLGSRRRPNRA